MDEAGWERSLLAMALVAQTALAGLALVAIALLATVDLVPPETILPALPAVLAGPLSAPAVLRPDERRGRSDRVAIGIQIAVQVGLGTFALIHANELLTAPRSVAPIAFQTSESIAVAAFSALMVWGLLRALRTEAEGAPANRMRFALIAAATATAVFGGATAVAVALDGTRIGCDVYRFDRDGWNEDAAALSDRAGSTRSQIADALIECGELEGRTEDEVRDMLGAGGRVRWSEQSYGIGDERVLDIRYGADLRVRGAAIRSLRYP